MASKPKISAQQQPQLVELVTTLLSSTRGLVALSAVIGSIVALIYLFVVKKSSTITKPSKRSSQTKRSPAKSSSTTSPLALKKAVSSPKKESRQTPAKQSTAEPTKNSVSTKKKAGKILEPTVSQKKAAKQVTVKQAQSQPNDDGEWITVAKKKSRVSPAKKSTDEEPSPSPQTRSSTRRSAQATKVPRK